MKTANRRPITRRVNRRPANERKGPDEQKRQELIDQYRKAMRSKANG